MIDFCLFVQSLYATSCSLYEPSIHRVHRYLAHIHAFVLEFFALEWILHTDYQHTEINVSHTVHVIIRILLQKYSALQYCWLSFTLSKSLTNIKMNIVRSFIKRKKIIIQIQMRKILQFTIDMFL